jgi:putative membrane protein
MHQTSLINADAAVVAHSILARFLYAHPPDGVPLDEARVGARLMYYGGDAVDLALVVLLCREWYARAASAGRPSPQDPVAERGDAVEGGGLVAGR